jgi:heme-degrading monooxygenase HmoA
MLCAHTVRRLKPGTYDAFVERFAVDENDRPEGWVRFHVLRGVSDENEVVTFGFFDGTLEELERSQADEGYDERRASIDEYVEEVVANGIYEVAVSLAVESPAS